MLPYFYTLHIRDLQRGRFVFALLPIFLVLLLLFFLLLLLLSFFLCLGLRSWRRRRTIRAGVRAIRPHGGRLIITRGLLRPIVWPGCGFAV